MVGIAFRISLAQTVGDFVTPSLVGGPDGLMIANMIQGLFGKINNWPLGAALSITMMFVVAIISLLYVWVSRQVAERFL